MSLMVTPALLEQARTGKVNDSDFLSLFADSPPYNLAC